MITLININSENYGLGDTVCILPYIERYRQLTNHEVWFNTTFSIIKELIRNSYPLINIGIPERHDVLKTVFFHYDRPMQKSAAEGLEMPFEILTPKLDVSIGPRNIKQRYVTLSMQSTFQNRYWNYPGGWDILTNELNKKYKLSVVCVDRYSNFGYGKTYNQIPRKVIDRTGVSIKDAINYMNHAEFHIGLSSGLSWVAHAIGKPVVVMKSATKDWFEFQQNMITINNESVCNGCLNVKQITVDDIHDWNFCPMYKNTSRMFECSKSITPKMFLDKMKPLLNK